MGDEPYTIRRWRGSVYDVFDGDALIGIVRLYHIAARRPGCAPVRSYEADRLAASDDDHAMPARIPVLDADGQRRRRPLLRDWILRSAWAEPTF